jgi:hypothetical protein
MQARAAALFDHLADFLFQPALGARRRWLAWAWVAGLWLVGVFLLGQLLNWGRGPYDFHDWAEVNAARLAFVQDAVKTGQLPLHMPDASALRGVTDRYLALPDAILSPQMLLLPLFSVTQWVLFNTLLLYSLGALALAWMLRRFDLSPLVFALLFLIYAANGHMQAHLSVGHVNFAAAYLFPWLLVLLIQAVDAGQSDALPGWRWVAKTAFLLLYILLNGAFHQFVWCLFFLGFFGLFSWKYLPLMFKTLVASCLLAMLRLLPPALGLGLFDNEYLGGYPTFAALVTSLVQVIDPYQALGTRGFLTPLGAWEFDLFIGLSGAVFLLGFGLWRWLRHVNAPDGFPQFVLPALALAVLAVGQMYRPFMLLPIPLVNGERVSSRMIILPFLVLTVMAAVQMQRWLAERPLRPELRWGIAGLALLLLHDLWQHTRAWNINVAADAFGRMDVNLAIKVVANHPDPAYTNLLLAGALVTLVTALGLVLLARGEKVPDSSPR